ncbi:hypothetical protein GJ496_002410 [Pomphorhynchus laevis]|nr:hypothetical protein GJ496_002410 [Pomphorhynchus laevis]
MWWSRLFYELFLPKGYPHSVSSDYINYQIWDSIQALASSVMMAVSMTASFQGYGVGDKNVSVYASTLTWLFKDGIGMIGKISFAWYLSSNVNVKTWRLMADICNDASFIVEMMIPKFLNSRFVIPIIFGFGGLLRAIVSIAGGASRAMIAQHQAKSDNIADILAKDNSQEVLVNLIALFCNFVIISVFLQHQYIRAETVLVVCLIIHLYSNYMLVRSINLDTINLTRMAMLCERYATALISGENLSNIRGFDIQSINTNEPLFYKLPWILNNLKIAQTESFTDKQKESLRVQLLSSTAAGVYDDVTFCIVLTPNFKSVDLLRECGQFCFLNISLNWGGNKLYKFQEAAQHIKESITSSQKSIDKFFKILEQNRWNLDKTDFEIGPIRHDRNLNVIKHMHSKED